MVHARAKGIIDMNAQAKQYCLDMLLACQGDADIDKAKAIKWLDRYHGANEVLRLMGADDNTPHLDTDIYREYRKACEAVKNA